MPPGCGRDAAVMLLGAVLAGGRSSRFGRDKALAELDGESLMARAVRQLGEWCDAVIVVGRMEAPARTVPDWPRPDCGPLGGIAGALRHAHANGFETVLTVGVDAPDLPAFLPRLLAPAPAFVASQPVIGLWPASAAAAVETILAGDGRHSMRALALAVGARPVPLAEPPANINTPADLAAAAGD